MENTQVKIVEERIDALEGSLSHQLRNIAVNHIKNNEITVEELSLRLDILAPAVAQILEQPRWSIDVGIVVLAGLDIDILLMPDK